MLNQQVKVVQGKYTGKGGSVIFYRKEGKDGGRITLLSDGQEIYVDQDDIDFKFEAVDILLMLEADERAEVQQKIDDMSNGNCYS